MNIIFLLGGLLLVIVIISAGVLLRKYVVSFIVPLSSVSQAEEAQITRIENAETASATVLALSYPTEDEALYSFKKNFINTIIKLEVLPPVGTCYQTSVKWEVDKYFLDKISPGAVLKVKVDENDPEIIYPFGNWAFLKERLN